MSAQQLVVPLDDLHPVGLLGRLRVGVQGGDRGLRLVLAEPVARQRRLQDATPSAISVGVPPGPVLLGQRDEAAVGVGAGGAAGVVQQHQREQARRPPASSVIDAQLAGQPDRLVGEVDLAGVALVEDQVEHPQHGGQVAGLVEAHARRRCAWPG